MIEATIPHHPVPPAFRGLGEFRRSWQQARHSCVGQQHTTIAITEAGLELIAERKVRHKQLTDDSNVEITGRDLRAWNTRSVVLVRSAIIGPRRERRVTSRSRGRAPIWYQGRGRSLAKAWVGGSIGSSQGSKPIVVLVGAGRSHSATMGSFRMGWEESQWRNTATSSDSRLAQHCRLAASTGVIGKRRSHQGQRQQWAGIYDE
jgi:hypothetical protein